MNIKADRNPYEEVRHNLQTALEAHNAEETPLFAAGIERKALTKEKSYPSFVMSHAARARYRYR